MALVGSGRSTATDQGEGGGTPGEPSPQAPCLEGAAFKLPSPFAIWLETQRLWKIAGDSRDKFEDGADRTIVKRADAYEKLLTTLPARSLADAAVQVEVAMQFIAKLADCDFSSDRHGHDDLILQIERLLASALKVLLPQAGINDPTMFDPWSLERYEHHFRKLRVPVEQSVTLP